MLNRVKALGATLLVSGIIGCGGSSGGGSVTGLPASTGLMTLTPAQKTQLCNDVSAYVSRNISDADGCKLSGLIVALIAVSTEPTISDAQLQTACSDAVTSCNATPSQPGECTLGDTSTCSADATVADVSACISDDTAAVKSLIATVPACSALTKAWLETNANALGAAAPASCTALDAKCPDIMM
jgi:hypothetical protein